MVTWEKRPLLECVDLLQGLTYSPSNVKSHGLLVLRSSNIKNGKLVFDDCVYVDCFVDENNYVKPNDILICVRNGSSALIGKSCVIDNSYNATFGAFMTVLRGDKTGYIAQIFTSDIVQNQIRNRSNATINQITKRDFEDIVIPIPRDEKEQRRIAEILSDTDALIAALEKLIAKKRAIKQGAMQELLTGKRRLPGFNGEWVETTLGELSEIRMCKRIFAGQTSPTGDIPFYKIGTFGKEADAYISHSLYEDYKEKYSFPQKGDILLSAAGTLGRTVVYCGKPSYFQDSNIVWLEIDEKQISNKYLYHFYQIIIWASPEGSTISRLYNSIIRDTVIVLPPSLAEQTAIAEILSDMDAEIDALTAKLNKVRNIKQGMMSELLTGRIRLPEEKPETTQRYTPRYDITTPMLKVAESEGVYSAGRNAAKEMEGGKHAEND